MTGSSVMQETVRRRGAPTIAGQAVWLDLGQNRELFLLFPGYRGTPHPLINLPFEAFPDGKAEPLERVRKLLRDRPYAELPLTSLPIMVHFVDRTNRMSIHTINPADIIGAFGPGVRMRKVTIEITDDPVSTGLETELPWLADLKTTGRAIDGSRLNSGDTQYSWLGHLAFKR